MDTITIKVMVDASEATAVLDALAAKARAVAAETDALGRASPGADVLLHVATGSVVGCISLALAAKLAPVIASGLRRRYGCGPYGSV